MDVATAKCATCGYVRVATAGPVDEKCPRCSSSGAAEKRGTAPPPAKLAALPAIATGDPVKLTLGVMLVAALAMVLVAALARCSAEPDTNLTPENRLYNGNWYRIRDNCRTAIGAQLHDPSSAEWGDERASSSPGEFTIVYEVRAKNGFGAYRLTRFICTVSQSTLRVISAVSIQ